MGQMTFKNDNQFQALVRFCNQRTPEGAYQTRLKPDTKVCLWLVHDQGVYLMPGVKDGGKPDTGHVIYARGCDPSKDDEWYDRARDLVGGDDFAESVELPAAMVERILDETISKMRIKLTETNMTVETS